MTNNKNYFIHGWLVLYVVVLAIRGVNPFNFHAEEFLTFGLLFFVAYWIYNFSVLLQRHGLALLTVILTFVGAWMLPPMLSQTLPGQSISVSSSYKGVDVKVFNKDGLVHAVATNNANIYIQRLNVSCNFHWKNGEVYTGETFSMGMDGAMWPYTSKADSMDPTRWNNPTRMNPDVDYSNVACKINEIRYWEIPTQPLAGYDWTARFNEIGTLKIIIKNTLDKPITGVSMICEFNRNTRGTTHTEISQVTLMPRFTDDVFAKYEIKPGELFELVTNSDHPVSKPNKCIFFDIK